MQNKTYPEAGEVLYNIIVDKINTEDQIIIDLDGVASLPSMFLNTSIGKFVNDYGVDVLRKKILFAKISVTQADRLKEYINRL